MSKVSIASGLFKHYDKANICFNWRDVPSRSNALSEKGRTGITM